MQMGAGVAWYHERHGNANRGEEMSGIRARMAEVSQDRLRRDVFYLASDPLPRRTANFTLPGHAKTTLDEADDWLCAELALAGLNVSQQTFQVKAFGCDMTKPLHHWYAPPPEGAPDLLVRNLIAELPGDARPEEILVLVAHKDSQSWIECPGASQLANTCFM